MKILFFVGVFCISTIAFNQSQKFIKYSAEMNGRYAHEYEEALVNEVVLSSSDDADVEFVFERNLAYRDYDGVGTESFTASVVFDDEMGTYTFSTNDKEVFGYCVFENGDKGELIFIYMTDDGNNYEEKFYFEGEIDLSVSEENIDDNGEKEIPEYIENTDWYDENSIYCYKNDNGDVFRLKEIEGVLIGYLEKEVIGDGYHYMAMQYVESVSKPTGGKNIIHEWTVVEGFAEYDSNEMILNAEDNSIEFNGEIFRYGECGNN